MNPWAYFVLDHAEKSFSQWEKELHMKSLLSFAKTMLKEKIEDMNRRVRDVVYSLCTNNVFDQQPRISDSSCDDGYASDDVFVLLLLDNL